MGSEMCIRDRMSDQSWAGCFRGRRAGARWVLVALVIGAVTWTGCGDDEPSTSGQVGGDPAGDTDKGHDPVPSETSVVWETEQFQAVADQQLQLLVDDLERDGRFDPEVLVEVATTDFTGDRLHPDRMPVVHESGGLVIRRQETVVEDGSSGEHGVSGGCLLYTSPSPRDS